MTSRRHPRPLEPCHTPTKTSFISAETAASAAKHATWGGPLEPYRCACGFYHLTSHPRTEQTA